MTAKDSRETLERPPTPMSLAPSPLELARMYADIALGYHRRLPGIEDRLDRVLEAVKLIRLEQTLSPVTPSGPKRTTSGQMAAVVPPPVPPIELKDYVTVSKTGSHVSLETERLEALERRIREQDAREEGMRLAAEQAALEADAVARDADRREDRWRNRITLALAIVIPSISATVYVLTHVFHL